MNILTWTLIKSSVSGQHDNINNNYGNSKCSEETLQKERLNLRLSAWSGFAYSREMGTIKYLKFNCINLYLQINCKWKKNYNECKIQPVFQNHAVTICTYAVCFPGAVHKQKRICVQIQHEMWETSAVLSFLHFIHNMKISPFHNWFHQSIMDWSLVNKFCCWCIKWSKSSSTCLWWIWRLKEVKTSKMLISEVLRHTSVF